MKARADWVMKAIQYVGFQSDYEEVFIEINRRD